MTISALRELERALQTSEVCEASVVVLRGEGRCWSAGLDVREHLRPQARAMLAAFAGALHALAEVPVPTIAQVHGACLGGGLELLSMCDMAVAGQGATFGQPEVKLGVFPPVAAAHYAQRIGHQAASHLSMLGESIDAAEARRLGFVNRVVPDEELAKTVEGMAATLEGHRRAALVHTKSAMRAAAPIDWAALRLAEEVYLHRLMVDDASEEGLRAFMEKRKPTWRD